MITLIVGPQGSGKSTLAKEIQERAMINGVPAVTIIEYENYGDISELSKLLVVSEAACVNTVLIMQEAKPPFWLMNNFTVNVINSARPLTRFVRK